MTHNELVHDLCTQDSIVVQNFAELMRFVLDGKAEVIYDGWINVYVPIWFDADMAFGLDLNSEENADWINMYIDWLRTIPFMPMYLTATVLLTTPTLLLKSS